jgi:hypothetical protein
MIQFGINDTKTDINNTIAISINDMTTSINNTITNINDMKTITLFRRY